MKAPAPTVRFFGHPLVAGAILLVSVPFGLMCLLRGGDGFIFALIIGVMLARLMRANATVMEYRAWKKAWDGMADQPPRPKRGMAAARIVVAVLASLFALAHLHDPQVLAGLMFIGLAGLVWVGASFGRRFGIGLGRRSRPAATDLVSIVVRGPLMPIPTLQEAFRALPDHCQCLRQTTAS